MNISRGITLADEIQIIFEINSVKIWNVQFLQVCK